MDAPPSVWGFGFIYGVLGLRCLLFTPPTPALSLPQARASRVRSTLFRARVRAIFASKLCFLAVGSLLGNRLPTGGLQKVEEFPLKIRLLHGKVSALSSESNPKLCDCAVW